MSLNRNITPTGHTLLSVVIPTYNRPEALIRTLAAILPQARLYGIPVCIIDNACPVPVEGLMDSFPQFRDLVKIIRNRVNVGGNANLCRCFELCESEWMWMLGDDDLPDENCLVKILDEIELLEEQCCFVNFSSTIYNHPVSLNMDGLESLSKQVKTRRQASNLLFISAGIFHIPKCQKYLIEGYQNTYTCAPHLAIVFSVLGNNAHSCRFSKSIIVQHVEPSAENNWSMLTVFAGIPGLYELDGQHGPMRSLVKVYLVLCRWNLFVINGTVAIFRDTRRPPRLWLLMLFRAGVLGNWWVKIQCTVMIAVLPLASIPFIRKAIGWSLCRFDRNVTAENKRK